jgi:hypothetical protein
MRRSFWWRLKLILFIGFAAAIVTVRSMLALIAPQGRSQVPKVRAFADFAVPRLKAHFGRLAADAGGAKVIHPSGGRVFAR